MPNINPFAVSEKQAQLVEHVEADLSPCHDRLLIRQFVDIDSTYVDELAKDLRMRTSMANPEGIATNYVDDPYVGNIGPERGGRVYEGRWRGVSVRTNVRNGRGVIIQTLAYGLIGSHFIDDSVVVSNPSAGTVLSSKTIPQNILKNYLLMDDGTDRSPLYEIGARVTDNQFTLASPYDDSLYPVTGTGYICNSFPAPCAIGTGGGMEIISGGTAVTLTDGILPYDNNLSIAGRYALKIHGVDEWYTIASRGSDTSLTLDDPYFGSISTDCFYTIFDLEPRPEIVQTDDKLMMPHAAIWEAEKEQREVRYRGLDPKFVEAYRDLIELTDGVVDVRVLRMQDGSYNVHALTDENFWVVIDNESPIEHTRIRMYSIDDEKTTNAHIRDFLHATKDSADGVFDDPAPAWVTGTDYNIGDLVTGQVLNNDDPQVLIDVFAIAIRNFTSDTTLQDDIDANNMAKCIITRTTMRDNTDGSGQVRQEIKEVDDDLGDPYITRAHEIINPFGCGRGEMDSLIFKWKDLTQESEAVHFAMTEEELELLAQEYVPNIKYVKRKWEVNDDGTCTLWVMFQLYTRMSFWSVEPTDPAEPWVDGIPEGPCYYEVVNIGTEYETHIKKWFGIQRSDHATAFLYLTNQITRPTGFVLGELRIRDTQKNAFDYTQVVVKQAKPTSLSASGVTTENRYKVLNVLGLEVGKLDMATVVYDNLLQSDTTPANTAGIIDYAVAEVTPTLKGNGRWRKVYIHYKVNWSNYVAGDPEADPPTEDDAETWRSRVIENEGGYGENTHEWASGVPVEYAEAIIEDKSGPQILSASFTERQLGEAHVTYVERTGAELAVVTSVYDAVGSQPARQTKTWHGVPPDVRDERFTTAQSWTTAGLTHKGADMSVQPNGFATITAVAVDLAGWASLYYTDKENQTRKFVEKASSAPNNGFLWGLVTVTYDVKYHYTESNAYAEVDGKINYLMSNSVTQVQRGNLPVWRTISIVSVASEAIDKPSPIVLPLPPP